MAQVSQINVLDSDDQLSSAIWNQEMGNIYAGLTGVATSQLGSKSVTLDKLADAANPGKRESDHGFSSYVASRPDSNSFRFSSATTLSDAKLGAGVAYVLKTSSNELVQIDRSSGPIPVPTLTGSSTNYVFLKADNTLRVSTSATAATDEMVITTLTTDSTTVTSSSFLARTSPFTNAFPEGYMVGRVITPGTTPARHVTLVAGLKCKDTDASFDMELSATLTDIDLDGGTGAGKLDTGSPATSTLYGIWLIVDSTGANATSAVFSTNITTGPTMPAGYNKKRLIGVRFNDSGGDLRAVTTIDSDNQYDDLVSILASGNATSATEVDVGTAMGMATWFSNRYSNKVRLALSNSGSASTDDFYLKIGGGTAVSSSVFTYDMGSAETAATLGTYYWETLTAGTNGASIQYIKVAGDTTGRLNIDCAGWQDNLGKLP